jgi:hypothetical protein
VTEDGDSRPMTLSREDLFELVWSKPMADLAKDFGISDVALAKRCKRLAIPVPGRGYWARVDAGQTPYKPKLLKREPQWGDRSALTVTPAVAACGAEVSLGAENGGGALKEGETTRARIAALRIQSSVSIPEALPSVRRTAMGCKHGRRSELKFHRGEKSGPVVALNVTNSVLDRALLLADTLLRAAETLEWTFEGVGLIGDRGTSVGCGAAMQAKAGEGGGSPESLNGYLAIEGERVGFRIEERFRDEPIEPTAAQLAREKREYGYRAPRKIAVPTGALRLVMLDPGRLYGERGRLTWFDRKGKRVEDQIPEILSGFHETALAMKLRRAKAERAAREREEQERQRKETEAIQQANQKLIKQLETDAGAWHRARYLRRYVREARRTLGSQVLQAKFRDETVDFLKWAEAYVDQLDPLRAVRRTGEFDESSTYRYHTDLDRMKNAFGRLLGAEWPDAFKIGKDYAQKPRSRGYWYSGDRSVFDVSAHQPEDRD